jgi:cell division protein ZapA
MGGMQVSEEMSASGQPEKPQESVVVEIYDQQYHLRGTDVEHVMELARLVDSKMHAVAQQSATADSLRVAVLAALNIADELAQLREQVSAGGGVVPQEPGALRLRADSLNSLLDEVLGE